MLPLITGPADVVTRPEALVRAVLAARQHLPADTLVIPVPLAARAGEPDAAADLRAAAIAAAAYGATHLLADSRAARGGGCAGGTKPAPDLPGVPIPSSAPASGPTTRGRRCGGRSP